MTTPAGWYDDGSGTQRYWDGTAWTEQTEFKPPPPYVPITADSSAATPSPDRLSSSPLSGQAARLVAYLKGLAPVSKLLLGVGVVLVVVLLGFKLLGSASGNTDDPPAEPTATINWSIAVPYLDSRWPGPWQCPLERTYGALICTSGSSGDHVRLVVGTGLAFVDLVLVSPDNTTLLAKDSVPESDLGITYK